MTPTHTSPTGKYSAFINVRANTLEVMWWETNEPDKKFCTLYKLSEIDHRGNVAGWVRINKEPNQ